MELSKAGCGSVSSVSKLKSCCSRLTASAPSVIKKVTGTRGVVALKLLSNYVTGDLILWTDFCIHLGLASHPVGVSHWRKSVWKRDCWCEQAALTVWKRLQVPRRSQGPEEEKRCPSPTLLLKYDVALLIPNLRGKSQSCVCIKSFIFAIPRSSLALAVDYLVRKPVKIWKSLLSPFKRSHIGLYVLFRVSQKSPQACASALLGLLA